MHVNPNTRQDSSESIASPATSYACLGLEILEARRLSGQTTKPHLRPADVISTIPQMTDGDGSTLDSAALGLSWRRNPDCIKSWSSLMATASHKTLCTASTYTADRGVGYENLTKCIHYQAPMVSSSTAVDHCCGQCTVGYPEVIVYHWPTPGTNTWCDSVRTEVSVCSQEHHLIYDGFVTTPAPIKTTYLGRTGSRNSIRSRSLLKR